MKFRTSVYIRFTETEEGEAKRYATSISYFELLFVLILIYIQILEISFERKRRIGRFLPLCFSLPFLPKSKAIGCKKEHPAVILPRGKIDGCVL